MPGLTAQLSKTVRLVVIIKWCHGLAVEIIMLCVTQVTVTPLLTYTVPVSLLLVSCLASRLSRMLDSLQLSVLTNELPFQCGWDNLKWFSMLHVGFTMLHACTMRLTGSLAVLSHCLFLMSLLSFSATWGWQILILTSCHVGLSSRWRMFLKSLGMLELRNSKWKSTTCPWRVSGIAGSLGWDF